MEKEIVGENRKEIHLMEQGSDAWKAIRRGKITGTGFAKVLSTRGETRLNYMRQLVLERKTGITVESFTNEAMEWGTKTEPQARAYYEKIYHIEVDQVGFVSYTSKNLAVSMDYANYVGVSPDGLLGDLGCIEIKCPNTSTHIGYAATKSLPSKYNPQVQGLLWVTDRKWCDFISFDPRVEKEPFWCIHVERDEAYINKLAAAVSVFIDEMVKMQLETVDVDPQLLVDVTAGSNEDDWLLKKQMEIRGKVRHGVVCALIQGGMCSIYDAIDEHKPVINKWVDFIMTGK